MSERKSLCDLSLVTVDYGWSDAKTREPGNTFRLTFRHSNGTQTGRIDIDESEAQQFVLELGAVIGGIASQVQLGANPKRDQS